MILNNLVVSKKFKTSRAMQSHTLNGKIKVKDGNKSLENVPSSIRMTEFFFKVDRIDSFCICITENRNSYLSFLPNPKWAPK